MAMRFLQSLIKSMRILSKGHVGKMWLGRHACGFVAGAPGCGPGMATALGLAMLAGVYELAGESA